MTVRLRQGGREFEGENLAAVRQGFAEGWIKPDAEVWDPLEERWRPVAEFGVGQGTAAAPSSRTRADGKSGADARRGRRTAIIAAAVLVAVAAAATGAFLLYRRWRTPSDEELNRITVDERAAQDALRREKGANYVKDRYRQRWQADPENPMNVYLHVRHVREAGPADREQLLLKCAANHPAYAWCQHALSWFYRETRQWDQARVFAEEAANAFAATDIEENLRWLERANAEWYTAWSGTRSASVVCKSGDYLLADEWTVSIRERARGFACPTVCSDPDRATLCYDVNWSRSYGRDEDFQTWRVSLGLDDGSTIGCTSSPGYALYHSDGRPMESDCPDIRGRSGSAILGLCSAPDRKVVSLVFDYHAGCDADFR
jgi:hypothetical protein